MSRRPILATTLLARVRLAVESAQALALRRRSEALAGAPLPLPWLEGAATERARWIPRVVEVRIAFEGTTRGEGLTLQVIPGRPPFARLMPGRIRWIEVCCDAANDLVPRLYIDGRAVDATGPGPQP
jgi:hypothetical protein